MLKYNLRCLIGFLLCLSVGNCKDIGPLIHTHNNMGTVTHMIDPVTEAFLKDSCAPGRTVLEIGAGIGLISTKAFQRGAQVWINDLDPSHLEIFKSNIPLSMQNRITLAPGDFPEKVDLPSDHFDAVLLGRVIHFFPPDKLERTLERLFQILKAGGRIYIITNTPFVGHLQPFMEEYQQRKQEDDPYPGYIKDISVYTGKTDKHFPSAINSLDIEVMTRLLKEYGFIIDKICYIPRPDYPEGVQLDGRESLGVIAHKP